MAQKINKLELTWIDKDEDPTPLEPRILLDSPEHSYGEVETATLPNGKPWPGNMLIHGDNLLALRALEQNFTGAVKCIFIDPPFNTGNAFEHYDDGVEHSIWLNLMWKRFHSLYKLLTDDGVLFVHLDDTELAYCKVILDEIFGRNNYLNTITMTTNEPSGFKATAATIFSTANFILCYAKDKYKCTLAKVYIEKGYDKAYSKVLLNPKDNYNAWKFSTIIDEIAKSKGLTPSELRKNFGAEVVEKLVSDYAQKNAPTVFRTAAIGGGAKLKRQSTINKSKEHRNQVFVHPNEDVDGFYILNGEQIIFYSNRLKNIDGKLVPGQIITDVWTDIGWTGIANEGLVEFKNGKKPEKLIKRCLELATKKGDIVLDSFLGSGTTAAVAHKMGRKWIGIEMGKQAFTHDVPRLKRIIKNQDNTGISKIVNWKGGGGFKFYELAPSLLNHDKHGNLVINKEYNADMLAAAMAKQEGYTYAPDKDAYWKQGRGSEKDFIFTTTQFLTAEALQQLHEQMGEDESLLICCTSFQPECRNRYSNITIKKIPQMLLGRCEFDKDDYSLNIISVPTVGTRQAASTDEDGNFNDEDDACNADSADNNIDNDDNSIDNADAAGRVPTIPRL